MERSWRCAARVRMHGARPMRMDAAKIHGRGRGKDEDATRVDAIRSDGSAHQIRRERGAILRIARRNGALVVVRLLRQGPRRHGPAWTSLHPTSQASHPRSCPDEWIVADGGGGFLQNGPAVFVQPIRCEGGIQMASIGSRSALPRVPTRPLIRFNRKRLRFKPFETSGSRRSDPEIRSTTSPPRNPCVLSLGSRPRYRYLPSTRCRFEDSVPASPPRV